MCICRHAAFVCGMLECCRAQVHEHFDVVFCCTELQSRWFAIAAVRLIELAIHDVVVQANTAIGTTESLLDHSCRGSGLLV